MVVYKFDAYIEVQYFIRKLDQNSRSFNLTVLIDLSSYSFFRGLLFIVKVTGPSFRKWTCDFLLDQRFFGLESLNKGK